MPARTRQDYGTAHRKRRAAWAPLVAAGTVNCWRCHQPIVRGEPWDLGHRVGIPSHPEHRDDCNRSAGAQDGNAQPRARPWTA